VLVINVQRELLASSFLASAFGIITSWSVKMEDAQSDRKLVGLPTNPRCAKIKDGYIVVAFMKLLDFSYLLFQIEG